jgi:UDP-N-acetylmuramate dehydrogenase
MINSTEPFDDNVQINQPILRYTAARLGGLADYLYIAKDPQFFDTLNVLDTAWAHDIPVTFIGGGANVLVSDKGIRGLTIVNRITQLDYGEWENGTTVSATSGASLIRLARYCQEHGYAGMEWAIGVPGTVGGAVVNNAGAHGRAMSDSIHHAVVYEPNVGARLYTAEELQYDYRHSLLKMRKNRRFMVLLATFKLEEDNPRAIQERMYDYNAYRKRTQPPGASLGSIFKNPPDDYAGRLIEMAGLKGYQIGGVQVSPIHANFFVNTGDDATAADYMDLIHYVQQVVLEKSDIELELEIQIMGEWN